jgi:hypothetical protein
MIKESKVYKELLEKYNKDKHKKTYYTSEDGHTILIPDLLNSLGISRAVYSWSLDKDITMIDLEGSIIEVPSFAKITWYDNKEDLPGIGGQTFTITFDSNWFSNNTL